MAVAVAGWSGATAAAEVKVAPYGLTKDGRPVKSYTLVNDHGASATILDYGGAVAAIRVPDRNGVLGNTVMSFADLAGWEALGHANSIIGRFANRITRGFTLDGVHYPLQQDARGVTMHGGPPGYATRVWTVAPIRRRDGAAVTLTLDSPDGDQGFPGRVRVTATYRFTNDNALRLDFAATTDKPTVINLTNHIYFNLGGNSTTPVSGHDMQVMTDQAAVLEPGSPPTGEIRSVTGTPLDFTRPTVLAERLAITLGPQFDSADNAPAIPAGMARSFNIPYLLHAGDNRLNRIAARLHDPVSGRIMELRTTEMSVHVFTPAVVRAGLLSDAGKPFTRVPSIAFETQHLPDSPNRPEFPSTILRPGQTFRSTTIFGFTVDNARASPRTSGGAARSAAPRRVPRFEPDPTWPHLPSKWVFGQVSSISIDERGHAWVLQRPSSLRADQRARGMAAPPVIEFDQKGDFVQAWGGPGAGYDWPEIEHGIYADPRGFIWVGGNGPTDNHLVKFTRDGRFVMQIGRKGASQGNNDTENVRQAADIFYYAKTNELFVADGYGNRRVIVFDGDTGKFKRMWGAFGNKPLDDVPEPAKVPEDQRIPAKELTDRGPEQFVQPVHAVRVSNDGHVYVSDRGGKRVQVFGIDGTYETQVFIDRYCEVPHCGNGQTVAGTAFSNDPGQQFLYVASRSPARVWVLDRKTLEPLDSFGRPGVAPGEFYVMHHMNVDAAGNLYVTEVQDGKRVQKFVFKGLQPMRQIAPTGGRN